MRGLGLIIVGLLSLKIAQRSKLMTAPHCVADVAVDKFLLCIGHELSQVVYFFFL